MLSRSLIRFQAILIVTLCATAAWSARPSVCIDTLKASQLSLTAQDTDMTNMAYAVHNVGNMVFSITNAGVIGYSWTETPDYFTGLFYERGSEFPRHSMLYHTWGSQFWIGGVLDGDTLVSIAMSPSPDYYREFHADEEPFMVFETRSTGRPDLPGFDQAVSEQDIIAVYYDTLVPELSPLDFLRGTPHEPLHLEITQRSYAWSYEVASDFILFDITLTNIGDLPINDAYFGILDQPWVGFAWDAFFA